MINILKHEDDIKSIVAHYAQYVVVMLVRPLADNASEVSISNMIKPSSNYISKKGSIIAYIYIYIK